MNDDENSRRERRARARSDWPVRSFRLGEEPGADLRSTTTAEERLDMVWSITVDAWASAGREIPDYPRHEAPTRVVRPAPSEES